ncbi:unnamed protein product [Malus baccata var. baccata]
MPITALMRMEKPSSILSIPNFMHLSGSPSSLTQEFNFADSLHTWHTLSSDLRVLSFHAVPCSNMCQAE